MGINRRSFSSVGTLFVPFFFSLSLFEFSFHSTLRIQYEADHSHRPTTLRDCGGA